MIGGAFLCFEGAEKVLHMFAARKEKDTPEMRQQRLKRWPRRIQNVRAR